MRRSFVLAVGVLALAACGGGDDGGEESSGSGSGTEEADSTTTAAVSDLPVVPGVELVEATSAGDDSLRPLLSWTAVDGAARYSLLVFAEDGSSYWAWEGTETQVHLGGGTDAPLPDDVEGPTAEDAAAWFVVAHDAGGSPIAASPELPL